MKTISIETAVEEILRDIADANEMHSCDPEAIARVYSVLCVGPGEPVCVVTGDKSASMVYVDGRPQGDVGAAPGEPVPAAELVGATAAALRQCK